MTELQNQNITLKRPVGRSSFPASIPTDFKQSGATEEHEPMKAAMQHRPSNHSFEVYGGTGQVRSEQPSARGSKIDITV